MKGKLLSNLRWFLLENLITAKALSIQHMKYKIKTIFQTSTKKETNPPNLSSRRLLESKLNLEYSFTTVSTTGPYVHGPGLASLSK